jgi:glycerophosphoryl diester phosphodiesterase
VHDVLEPGGNRPILIAHRVGNAPDSIAAAVAAGADLIEADVHLYRRRLEVRHTKTLGVLPWLWDRWYLVPATAERLLLRALIDATPDATLMLDLKGWHPWLGRTVAKAMEQGAPGRPYIVASRQWGMLTAFEAFDHVQIIHSARSPRELMALPRRITRHRTDALCLHRRLLTRPRWVSLARRLAPTLLTWPVIDRASADEVLSQGADGLIIDGLDLLAELAKQRTG